VQGIVTRPFCPGHCDDVLTFRVIDEHFRTTQFSRYLPVRIDPIICLLAHIARCAQRAAVIDRHR
jgi:hypothetical protein